MEDSHIAHIDLDNNVSIFGVFDGHGGKIHFLVEDLVNVGREVALLVKDIFLTEIK